MKKLFIPALLVASALLLTRCKKNDTGGKVTVTAQVMHHEQGIDHPTVYVKFDAQEMPSDPTTNYDLKLEGHHENHVHIKELRYGEYYLYAVGFDSTIMQTVTGGVPLKIKWSERKEEIEVHVPVTE